MHCANVSALARGKATLRSVAWPASADTSPVHRGSPVHTAHCCRAQRPCGREASERVPHPFILSLAPAPCQLGLHEAVNRLPRNRDPPARQESCFVSAAIAPTPSLSGGAESAKTSAAVLNLPQLPRRRACCGRIWPSRAHRDHCARRPWQRRGLASPQTPSALPCRQPAGQAPPLRPDRPRLPTPSRLSRTGEQLRAPALWAGALFTHRGRSAASAWLLAPSSTPPRIRGRVLRSTGVPGAARPR